MKNPKVFISYSWSNHQHEEWVVNLATELREAGVDVILDKWDLKEGHDAISFMEKIVTDTEIKKVIIVSDRIYAEKADNRKGGVGTETQIISKEIYDKVDQDKFVVVVSEKNQQGIPYLPVYYKSRIYIDLSEPGTYAENFEKLLRWIYDKPLYKKPEIGDIPSFLSEGKQISLGTTIIFKRTLGAIKNGKSYADGALNEYFETLSKNLEKFRIKDYEGEFDDALLKNIEAFLPYRNEIIQIFSAIARYSPKEEFIVNLHRFFESLIPHMFGVEGRTGSYGKDCDNFRFIIHELFLYVIAILVKLDKFRQVSMLLNQEYYISGNSYYGHNAMVSFPVFGQPVRSLIHRNKRLNLRSLSLRADLLKERSQKSIGKVNFRDLMQADFILFMKAELYANDLYSGWWPVTLALLDIFPSPFEIFVRAESKQYFEKIKVIFGIQNPDDFKRFLKEYRQGKKELPRWASGLKVLKLEPLLNIEKLATRS